MRHGFTLMELSITLIIIGLLIGGLLASQSILGTSKIATTIAQIQRFDAAVANFKAENKFLPGDAPVYGGDGDGLIELTATGSIDNNVDVHACEIANFWNNIDPDTYISSACTGAPGIKASISGVTKNVPESKLGKTGSFFTVSALSLDGILADTTNPRNFYLILDPSQAQTILGSWYHALPTDSTNSAVKPVDLLTLDKKIDDGIANTGNVISGSIGGSGGGFGGPIATPLATCSSGATYQLQNTGYECTPLIRIGAQGSELQ
jgi:prepilin-type N-terminal cleavage/methylation domain-containing protein